MGKVSENKNGDLIVSETVTFTKMSKSKKYRVYAVEDKKNGIIINMYIDPSRYDDMELEELPIKIKIG